MTWTAVSDTTAPGWTATSQTTIPWGQLTPVTDQGDVDFVYVASEEFPMLASSETGRAIPALASVISGP